MYFWTCEVKNYLGMTAIYEFLPGHEVLLFIEKAGLLYLL